jgi:hypothetical protein
VRRSPASPLKPSELSTTEFPLLTDGGEEAGFIDIRLITFHELKLMNHAKHMNHELAHDS